MPARPCGAATGPCSPAIDATFAAGRLTAVIGPNGAGKSTLLEAAAGLLPLADGTVTLAGQDLAAIDRRVLARRRAYLPQRAGVDWPISVARVVALGLTPSLPAFGGLPDALRARVDRALAEFDLTALRDRPATELSGGELARVMLARAVVGDPELLIVDEPTAGLDPRHALDAVRRLRAHADAGRTVIVAAHDVDLVLRVADDVVALRDGALLWAGPVAAVDDVMLGAPVRRRGPPDARTRGANGPLPRLGPRPRLGRHDPVCPGEGGEVRRDRAGGGEVGLALGGRARRQPGNAAAIQRPGDLRVLRQRGVIVGDGVDIVAATQADQPATVERPGVRGVEPVRGGAVLLGEVEVGAEQRARPAPRAIGGGRLDVVMVRREPQVVLADGRRQGVEPLVHLADREADVGLRRRGGGRGGEVGERAGLVAPRNPAACALDQRRHIRRAQLQHRVEVGHREERLAVAGIGLRPLGDVARLVGGERDGAGQVGDGAPVVVARGGRRPAPGEGVGGRRLIGGGCSGRAGGASAAAVTGGEVSTALRLNTLPPLYVT